MNLWLSALADWLVLNMVPLFSDEPQSEIYPAEVDIPYGTLNFQKEVKNQDPLIQNHKGKSKLPSFMMGSSAEAPSYYL